MLDKTLTILLAGGVGSRLLPLTSDRAKPAVPFGGKYRIIDFSLSNCLHSGLRRILVLTQYKSHSLNKHLRDGWSIFNSELGEFITPLPPQMRADGGWYLGVVDALRQNRYLIERNPAADAELGIGGVDDGVHVRLVRDVALGAFDADVVDPVFTHDHRPPGFRLDKLNTITGSR